MRCFTAIVLVLFANAGLPAFGFHAAEHEAWPDFDVRTAAPPRTNSISAAHEAGVQRLHSHIADLRIGRDARQLRPNFVARQNGFLTGPNGRSATIPAAKLNRLGANDPHRVAKAFLDANPDLFGHDSSALTNASVLHEAVAPRTGLRSTVWQQNLDGIPIFGATLHAHVTRDGELVNVADNFVSNPAAAPRSAKAKLSAAAAETIARQSLGTTNRFRAELPTSPIWLPMDGVTLRRCWDVPLNVAERGETFRLLIDAETGEVLVRRCLTSYAAASYNVFISDSPSPFSPGWTTQNTNQPPTMARSLVTLDAISTNASPEGWMPDWTAETFNNNVDAHTDRNGDNIQDLPRPECDANRVFNFPLDLASHPTNSSAASVVQLFYWCNWMHDRLYDLGFDEAAGNFQLDNFGRGGVPGDPLQADGQDGSGFNNANMTTLGDGVSPRMQMYLWNGATPNRDGDLDAEIVLHEYTHGLSWRLVGGGVGISALQTQGMGEGWSDFYALALLSEPGDDPNGCYAVGGYVAHLFGGLPYSYYFGIRRYPYSTDMTKNPLTFGHLSQQVYDGSIPRNPIMTSTQQQSPAEVHNQGEVWCSALWEVRAKLIAKHGYAVGNQLALQLVTDGMKLSPPDPNFLQARDAILQADTVDCAGTNHNEIWAGFAKRGMGFSATCPNSSMTAGVVEAFDNGDALQATPDTGLTSSGGSGGAFTPNCQTYTLTNAGATDLSWSAIHTHAWFDVSPTAGTLATGEVAVVSVCFNAAASALAPGSYTDTVAFSNSLTGMVQARPVALDVLPTERAYFFPFDTDPAWTKSGTWTFGVPKGLGGDGGNYAGYADPTSGATGTNVYGVNLNGNYATGVGAQFNLTTPALNLTGRSNCVVQFQRWLNSDDSLFVQAEFYAGTNLANLTRVWANGLVRMESDWSKPHYDISAIADNQPTVYLRWSYRILRTSARPMSGWNIDDVEILASSGAPVMVPRLELQPTATNAVVLSWPTNAAGFELEHNFDVATTNWTALASPMVPSGTNHQVIVPLVGAQEYFRLKQP